MLPNITCLLGGRQGNVGFDPSKPPRWPSSSDIVEGSEISKEHIGTFGTKQDNPNGQILKRDLILTSI